MVLLVISLKLLKVLTKADQTSCSFVDIEIIKDVKNLLSPDQLTTEFKKPMMFDYDDLRRQLLTNTSVKVNIINAICYILTRIYFH